MDILNNGTGYINWDSNVHIWYTALFTTKSSHYNNPYYYYLASDARPPASHHSLPPPTSFFLSVSPSSVNRERQWSLHRRRRLVKSIVRIGISSATAAVRRFQRRTQHDCAVGRQPPVGRQNMSRLF